MRRLITIKVCWFSLALLLAPPIQAREATTEVEPPIPCAVIDSFSGELQILNATRTQVSDATKNFPVVCGSWISVGTGWVELTHRDGYKIHLGSQTFVEMPESNKDGKYSGEQLVLYRGQAFGQAGSGSGELRFLTPNARARTKRGRMIVMFNGHEEETQLVTLEDVASLENRFETYRHVDVKAGETSNLNFKILRVIPTSPKAVAIATLKPKLVDLHITERESNQAIQTAHARGEKQVLQRSGSAGPVGQRAPASRNYMRHRGDKVDADLKAHLARKVVAGEASGEKILYPDRFYGRPRKVSVETEEMGTLRKGQRRNSLEDAEKKRLIEELSKIRIE